MEGRGRKSERKGLGWNKLELVGGGVSDHSWSPYTSAYALRSESTARNHSPWGSCTYGEMRFDRYMHDVHLYCVLCLV